MNTTDKQFTRNRIANADNRYQNKYKRVLCVCSAGLLRSPTAAVVLSQEPFNFNTRAVGISQEFGLIPIDPVHVYWSDEIVCMSPEHTEVVENIIEKIRLDLGVRPHVYTLDIPDIYSYRDPELMDLIKTKYIEQSGFKVQ